jgi:N-acetylmuramoyl-L-alanine amidase
MTTRLHRTLLLLLLLTVRASGFDTVILDPGHGGHDRGAAAGFVYEKHLALDTARRVAQLLAGAGLKVVMTRDSDVFVPLDGRSQTGNGRSNAVFVSIHYNYNRGGSGHGVETYHCHDAGYALAAYIQAYVAKESGLENRGVKHANFHVIRATTRNPAVLVECGFVSNRSERSAMLTGVYREQVALGIAKGIIACKKVR